MPTQSVPRLGDAIAGYLRVAHRAASIYHNVILEGLVFRLYQLSILIIW